MVTYRAGAGCRATCKSCRPFLAKFQYVWLWTPTRRFEDFYRQSVCHPRGSTHSHVILRAAQGRGVSYLMRQNDPLARDSFLSASLFECFVMKDF